MSNDVLKKIAEKIIELRNARSWSQRDLAEHSGLSRTPITSLETCERAPTIDTLEKIASALDVPLYELLGAPPGIQPGDNHDMPQPADTVEVPLWAEIPCGPPTEISEGYLGAVPILRHLAGKGRYVIRAEGCSMDKLFSSGDLILVGQRDGISLWEANKKVCTVLLNGESTCKRVIVEFDNDNRPTRITLQPESMDPDCKPIHVDMEKDEFKVTGIVLKVVDHDVV